MAIPPTDPPGTPSRPDLTLPGLAPPTVVLCAEQGRRETTTSWPTRTGVALSEAGLTAIMTRPCRGPQDVTPWVAAVAVEVTRTTAASHLIVVAGGDCLPALPALALALRARHRGIVGYVLVDAALDRFAPETPDWPGAPVTYLRTPGAPELGWRLAGLHGWARLVGDPARAVPALIVQHW